MNGVKERNEFFELLTCVHNALPLLVVCLYVFVDLFCNLTGFSVFQKFLLIFLLNVWLVVWVVGCEEEKRSENGGKGKQKREGEEKGVESAPLK